MASLNPMQQNPLIHPIHEVLKIETQGLSEYELIDRLAKQDHIIKRDALKDVLGLFRTHFLVMNALYQLQQQLLSNQRYLYISAQFIQMTTASDSAANNSIIQDSDNRLRSYYLDLKNLTETREQDVTRLLDEFWSRYLDLDERAQCLARLGLDEGAGWREIQQQYRRLAGSTHPDKGGDSESFIEIREAYRVLARIYRP
jgi:hypothetical protein